MIEYKASVAQEDFLDKNHSPYPASEKLSLTQLWEIISRTKRLPDGLDVHALYTGVREKLRDPEREVRQHALRVLVDLIPVTQPPTLDNHMRDILPELVSNLNHSAPALRKNALDSLRIYLQYSRNYDKLIKDLICSTEDDYIIAAVPYLLISKTNDKTMDMVLSQLWKDVNNPYVNKEVAAKSLATIGYSLGEERFKALIGTAKHNELQKICGTFGITNNYNETYSGKDLWNNKEDDRVILETEITLRTGPAITMKIHEECRTRSALEFLEDFGRDPSQMLGVINILEEDRDLDFDETVKRTPRKVRFGGESVKLRTPETDGSATDGGRLGGVISITVTDAVSIETKRSLIPIRISSLPATPRRIVYTNVDKRLHKSTPNLTARDRYSRIPLKKNSNLTKRLKQNSSEQQLTSQKIKDLAESHQDKNNNNNSIQVKQKSTDLLSPSTVHNEIEVFHNLTRSPVRKIKVSTQENENEGIAEDVITSNSSSTDQIPEERKKEEWQVVVYKPVDIPNAVTSTTEQCEAENNSSNLLVSTVTAQKRLPKMCEPENNNNEEVSYNSFQVFSEQTTGASTDDPSVTNISEAENDLHIMESNNNSFLVCSDISGNNESGPNEMTMKSINYGSGIVDESIQYPWSGLPSKSEVALAHLIEGWRTEELERCLWRLVPDICRARAPSGISMSLMIMKRCSPRKLQDEILTRCFAHQLREGALQVLMAIARFLPSTEIEISRITRFAAASLKDRRKRVRQAALETLATVASLSSNAQALEIVDEVTGFASDHQYLMNVVRTRLSRRQLPTIEDDGTIRYSSPKDQTEFEWLLGEKIYSDSSPSSASSSHSINYWSRNSRHIENDRTEQVLSNGDENTNGNQPVWAVDSSVFHRNGYVKDNKKTNTTLLQPVYILRPDAKNHSNQPQYQLGRYERGRSFSPPKHRRGTGGAAGSASPRGVAPAPVVRTGYFEGFRKSFSSEQLLHGGGRGRAREPREFSDRCSTSSTGSSTRSGVFQKEIKSGIPIPISSDTRLRFRTSNLTANNSVGPVVARIRSRKVVDVSSLSLSGKTTPIVAITFPPEVTEINIESPRDDPIVARLSPRDQKTQTLHFPPSSGSESSGYFTPPYNSNEEAFVKLEDAQEPTFDSVEKEEATESDTNNNSQECVNSCEDEVDDLRKTPQRFSKPSTPDSLVIENLSTENPNNHEILKVTTLSNIEDLQGTRSPPSFVLNFPGPKTPSLSRKTSPTIDNRKKSNSVVDLQNFLPEIPNRKNSAPPQLKEDVSISRQIFTTPAAEIPSPGKLSTKSLELKSDYEIVEPPEKQEEALVVTRKLSKRLSRTSSRKSIKATPRSVRGVTPVTTRTEPKDDLQLALAQMNNAEWEVMIQGLQGVARIAQQHPEVIEARMHNVCINLGRHIKNLRSQVARAACHTVTEMFVSCRKGLEVELEEIAGPLLHRTADTNKFLRADANAALDLMCLQLPAGRVISVLTARGCNHQNSVVRSTGIRLLADLVKKLGPERIYHLQKECRDKIFLAGAKSLVDGSLEARNHGKIMFSYLIGYQQFQRCLLEAVPQSTLRHVAKTLNSIKPFETN